MENNPKKRRTFIESSKLFRRLAEKTQVLMPKVGREEIINNRLTHSYSVAASADLIAETVGYGLELNESLDIICKMHDIGMPCGGHEGQKVINSFFKNKGVTEGFSDNNNNLVVIEKDQIPLTDYELASLIKYPEKLYPAQKKKYLKILEAAINRDIEEFKDIVDITSRPKRTLLCEIMDEADRNTYVCDDNADFLCLGFCNEAPYEELASKDMFFNLEIKELLAVIIYSVKTKDKSLIKRTFARVKNLLNQNYFLDDNLVLGVKDKEIETFREELFKIEKKYYLDNDEIDSARKEYEVKIRSYLEYVVENEFYPSSTYKKKIMMAKNDLEKNRLIRDMVGETTDWYVMNWYDKNRE